MYEGRQVAKGASMCVCVCVCEVFVFVGGLNQYSGSDVREDKVSICQMYSEIRGPVSVCVCVCVNVCVSNVTF